MGIDQVARSGKVRVFDPAERDPGSSGERGRTPVVRIYLLSTRGFQKLFILFKACLNGFWLGILDNQTLHDIDRHYYDENKRTYCSDKYNKSGLRSWEKAVTDEYFQTRERLLMVGVGGGREVLALRKLSYEVDGFECHPELLEYANDLLEREGLAPSVMLAPRDQCPAVGPVYDGAIVGWGAYMLIQGREKRIGFLRQMRSQVKEGSPVLLSFFTRSYDSLYFRLVRAIANGFRRALRRDRLETGDDLAPNYVHYFTEKEIAAELREAGFEIRFYSDKQYGHAVGIAG
jgi:hypothetical protein